jgi:hypothetical protein
MPAIPCPCCGRLLNLPETVRGVSVRCPLCQTDFQAPQREILQALPMAARAIVLPPRPKLQDPRPGAENLVFPPESDQPQFSPRGRAALQSVASWLSRTALLEFLGCVLNCVFGVTLPIHDPSHQSLAFMTLLAYGVPLLFITSAASQLSRGRGYWLSALGGIMALLSAPLSLLSAVPAGLHGIHQFDSENRHAFTGWIFLGVALLMLSGAASATVAGMKTFRVLRDREIRKSFR